VFYVLQGRIKKIMQTDEEVGKVAQAVPVIIYILWVKIYKRYLVFVVIMYVKVWNKLALQNYTWHLA